MHHRVLTVVAALLATLGGVSCQSPNPDHLHVDAESVAADLGVDQGTACTAGAACDDGDPCTVGDTCRQGRCTGNARDCADKDPCTNDACDLATGACSHEPSPGVTEGPPGEPSCDDGVDQDCDGATDAADADCRACETVADCPPADLCVTVKCEANRCVETPTDEGQTCDSGDPCREKGLCTAGRCESAEKRCPSPDPENPCVRGLCQPESGACAEGPVEDGTPCDDADRCTASDACEAGVCFGAPAQCGALDDACVAGVCDSETGACMATTVADGTPCGGDSLCVPVGTCHGGRCDGATVDCTALDGACRVGVCDPVTGGCTAEPAPAGAPCDDGDPCTFQDACGAQGCAGTALDCGVLDTNCQLGRCDPATGACAAEMVANGTPCDDGLHCTENDACHEGACGGSALLCGAAAGGCVRSVCDEASAGCALQAAPDDVACDDANRCTQADVCAGGICAGASALACPPPSECFSGGCDPANGACNFVRQVRGTEGEPDGATCADAVDSDCDGLVDLDDPDCRRCAADPDCGATADCVTFTCVAGRCLGDSAARDGQACDDDLDACHPGGVCQAGGCVALPLDCSAFDGPCTSGRCDLAAGGCVADQRSDGAPCEDGDRCTVTDTCQAGLCAGSGRDCSGLDAECVLGRCEAESGECVPGPRGDGAPCTDADPCTVTDACVGDTCVGAPAVCEAGACEVGLCDPDTGACRVQPAEEGAGCDDADPCTEGDACRAGACVGAPLDCADLDGPCLAGVCDAATGSCRAVPVPDLTPCDDGSLCTADEACMGGQCVGTSPDCSALDADCRVGACDPTTGRCAALPASNGAPCTDENGCTNNDVCTDGQCVGDSVDCSPLSSLCGMGRCDPASGACVLDPINEAGECDDGNRCTDADRCVAGRCAGNGLDCSNLTGPCTVGQCDAEGLCAAVPVDDGTRCVTEDLCLVEATCRAGVCEGTRRDCSDLDTACTSGACDPRNGACTAEPLADETPCDDGSVCSEREVCLDGRCEGHPLDCGMLDGPCTAGACDPEVPGGCFARPFVDGVACTSGNPCQVAEACLGGRCGGTPKPCAAPPAGSCRVAYCDPVSGACGFADAADGAACDDGLYCTTGETCSAGACGAGQPRACDPPGEPCKTGVCDETNDRCNVSNRNDRTACEDGQFCTTSEQCFGGVCRARAQRSCPDANAGCRVGACNEGADRCDLQDAFNLKPCLDGDLCTIGDRCDDGRCVPGLRVCN